MFFYLLLVLVAVAAIHAAVTRRRSTTTLAELLLIYLLAGYCGVAQLGMGIAALVAPAEVAAHMGVPAGNPIQLWTSFLLLGMAAIGILSIWLRGSYLVAPVVGWSIFFLGATYAHVYTDALNGAPIDGAAVLRAFVNHGMVSVLLIGLLIRVWIGKARPTPHDPNR